MIKRKEINERSDFKLIESSDILDKTIPFSFIFYTTIKAKGYRVSFDGKTYKNCRRLDDGRLLIIFDAPGFSSGRLRVDRSFYLTDTDFADGICNLEITEETDIWIGKNSTECEVESKLPGFYQKGDKGDPFEYRDFTPEQLNSLVIIPDTIDGGTV